MLKFRKVYNLKIVAILIVGLFLFNSTVYGIDLSKKNHLRAPLLNNSEEGRKRVQDGLTRTLRAKKGPYTKANCEIKLVEGLQWRNTKRTSYAVYYQGR